ncbi:hypothetical protein AVEN_217782-1, partial [Araneus ventricosus]
MTEPSSNSLDPSMDFLENLSCNDTSADSATDSSNVVSAHSASSVRVSPHHVLDFQHLSHENITFPEDVSLTPVSVKLFDIAKSSPICHRTRHQLQMKALTAASASPVLAISTEHSPVIGSLVPCDNLMVEDQASQSSVDQTPIGICSPLMGQTHGSNDLSYTIAKDTAQKSLASEPCLDSSSDSLVIDLERSEDTNQAEEKENNDPILVLNPSEEEKEELISAANIHDLRTKFPNCSGPSEVIRRPPTEPAFSSDLQTSTSHETVRLPFCATCKVEFLTEHTRSLHMNRVHGVQLTDTVIEIGYTCPHCKKQFSRLPDRRVHECTAIANDKRACELCAYVCTSGKAIRTHMWQVHGTKPIRRPRRVPVSQAEPGDIPDVPAIEDRSSGYGSNLSNSNTSSGDISAINNFSGNSFPTLDSNLPVEEVLKLIADTVNNITIGNEQTSAQNPDDSGNGNHDTSNSIVSSQNPDEPTRSQHTTCPPGSIQTDSSLLLLFPMVDPIRCTEEGCSTTYSTESWTSNKKSLKKHLREHHKIRITESFFWCAHCQDSFGKPSAHPCLRDEIIHRTSDSLSFFCSTCHKGFTSQLGLRNHEQAHRKREAEEQRPKLHIPNLGRRARPRLDPVPGEVTEGNIVNPDNALAPSVNQDFSLPQASDENNEGEEDSVFKIYLRRFRAMEQADLGPDDFHDIDELVNEYCVSVRAE